ncbi:hypothetical protein F7R91_28775 [Streptomyces luteolifulvus]|jgi:hypothetical protein|uniref:Peptidase inhibitor family I36 n=1 Tax=Streptomyces luteolifulvus TaxID=2615112 RepID=A0A6H9UUM7_9ACTN|nr:hypothetical protein [Streptomyces luteolifulvus]KAB1142508.1 hypothetical protein F7R91_28775 [Streptomyces luteolifulvus]
MKGTRKLAAIGATTAAIAAALTVAAPPASADTYNGCVWPRVCFYLTSSDWNAGAPNAAFQDVTSYYQNLGSRSRGADYVWNSRNDDRAYLRYLDSSGSTRYYCLPPNQGVYFPSALTVTGIRIDTAPSC